MKNSCGGLKMIKVGKYKLNNILIYSLINTHTYTGVYTVCVKLDSSYSENSYERTKLTPPTGLPLLHYIGKINKKEIRKVRTDPKYPELDRCPRLLSSLLESMGWRFLLEDPRLCFFDVVVAHHDRRHCWKGCWPLQACNIKRYNRYNILKCHGEWLA